MNIRNLTPHTINETVSGQSYPSTGTVARVTTTNIRVATWEDSPILIQVAGEVTDLPDQQGGTALIVSAMVRLALPGRGDLLSPGDLVRNEDGQPIGCDGFVSNLG